MPVSGQAIITTHKLKTTVENRGENIYYNYKHYNFSKNYIYKLFILISLQYLRLKL